MPVLSIRRSTIAVSLLGSLWLGSIMVIGGCAKDEPVPSGTFNGAAETMPKETIRMVLGTPGGDLVSGTWVQGASLPFANINATKTFWGQRHYTVDSTEGPCKGSFELNLHADGDHVSGDLNTGSACPLGKFTFQLTKTAAAIQPLTR